jgi:hypothetical protein
MAEGSGAPSYERIDRKVEVMDTPYDRWASSQGIDVIGGEDAQVPLTAIDMNETFS